MSLYIGQGWGRGILEICFGQGAPLDLKTYMVYIFNKDEDWVPVPSFLAILASTYGPGHMVLDHYYLMVLDH